ncbi:hypothetical protein, partial [Klebsiella pneumoniae]|uniref:hypothetical protein n=1 Tax=Klebsiella pneumoniae TaxID=573 RepID=UPI00259FE2C0
EADAALAEAEAAAKEAEKPEVVETLAVESTGSEIRVNADGSTTVEHDGREVTLPPVEQAGESGEPAAEKKDA